MEEGDDKRRIKNEREGEDNRGVKKEDVGDKRGFKCESLGAKISVESLTGKICTFLLADLWLRFYYDIKV